MERLPCREYLDKYFAVFKLLWENMYSMNRKIKNEFKDRPTTKPVFYCNWLLNYITYLGCGNPLFLAFEDKTRMVKSSKR